MWRREEYLALPAEWRHLPAPAGSSVPQSLMRIEHSSSTKWRTVWTYVLVRVVTEFLTAEGSSPIEIHRRLRSVHGEDAIMLVQLDAGSVVLREVKRILVTGLAALQ